MSTATLPKEKTMDYLPAESEPQVHGLPGVDIEQVKVAEDKGLVRQPINMYHETPKK